MPRHRVPDHERILEYIYISASTTSEGIDLTNPGWNETGSYSNLVIFSLNRWRTTIGFAPTIGFGRPPLNPKKGTVVGAGLLRTHKRIQGESLLFRRVYPQRESGDDSSTSVHVSLWVLVTCSLGVRQRIHIPERKSQTKRIAGRQATAY